MRRTVVALCAATLSLAACDGGGKAPVPPPAATFMATDITGAPWGKDFSLNDHLGQRRSLKDFRGKVVSLFFGYTHCPDVCPTTLSDFAAAKRELGVEGERLQVLFVSVDPERDTPELLARYVPSFDASFLGLLPSQQELPVLAKEFKVVYQKNLQQGAGRYLIDHSAGTYVFDPSGQLRLHIRYGAPVKEIVQDLRTLLHERAV